MFEMSEKSFIMIKRNQLKWLYEHDYCKLYLYFYPQERKPINVKGLK